MKRNIKHATVVGSTGFLGAWLVDDLIRAGVRVTGVSRRAKKLLDYLAEPDEWISADITVADPETYIRDSDVVFFLGGIASVPASISDPISDLDGNLRAALSILEYLRRTDKGAAFIYASSAAVYGSAVRLPMDESHPLQPLSPYGVSKLAAESYVRLYARSFNVPGAIARIFSVYGPGQDKQVVYDWSMKVAGTHSALSFFGAPDVSRDFIHVSDAASAFSHIAGNAALKGEVYNVASGDETTLEELAVSILDAGGSNASHSFTGSVRVGDPVRWQSDISALKKLDYMPKIALSDGIRETYAWAKSKIYSNKNDT